MFLSINASKANNGKMAGQATVEAAVLIPVVLLLLLVLMQPLILLYDRVVMQHAAAEACRMLATKTALVSNSVNPYEDYVRARLGAIPEEDHFHVHKQGCSWNIELNGDEMSSVVKVRIAHKVKPLPLIGFAANAVGLSNNGLFDVVVEASLKPRNDWVASNPAGNNPADWVAQWR